MADEQKQLYEHIKPLLESEHRDALAELLRDERSGDIAEVLEAIDDDELRTVFDVLDPEMAAEVLEKLDVATRGEVFDVLREKELHHIFDELGFDDAADLLAELPGELQEKVLGQMPSEEVLEISKLMSYSEDSAGGIMDPVLISVSEDATITEAIKQIQDAEIDEDFYSVFVVDKRGKFVGEIRIRQLLTHPEHTRIGPLVDSDAVFVHADNDQEEVRNEFLKNDLIVVPVLDRMHRLVGRITADRVLEVAEEEAAEDMYAMAGTDIDELDNFSAFHAARIRLTWLLPCLFGTAVTAVVMMHFKNYNSQIFVIAAAFVPMVAAMSGNAGLQTSTIVVSRLATGHLAALRFGQVFSREVRIALVVAVACAIIALFIRSLLPGWIQSTGDPLNNGFTTPESIRIVTAFALGMFAAIMVATTLGLLLPFLFRKIGIDPAISSGPLVTTANDSISVAIYFAMTQLLAT